MPMLASYNEALSRISKVLRNLYPLLRDKTCSSYLSSIDAVRFLEYIKLLLESLLILKGFRPPSLDVTNIAAIALDLGIISSKEFSVITDLNVKIRLGWRLKSNELIDVISTLLRRIEEVDPYVRRDLRLFIY
ncbi:MAG: hypothetical protein B6U85_05005 [Desulfurococcales archaeon ex4484_42]|nr:MAG: hypothetical protein B6U85_05005 [Desulfurococcales archaeon ex4484_42]